MLVTFGSLTCILHRDSDVDYLGECLKGQISHQAGSWYQYRREHQWRQCRTSHLR